MPAAPTRPRVHRRRRSARVATIVTVGLFVAITVLGLPLRTAAAPLGIVSLQFAASPDAASTMLASWVGVPRSRLLWTHALDLPLPVAYAIAVTRSVTAVALRTSAGVGSARVAGGAVLAAAIADQVENLAMGVSILSDPSWGSVLVTLAAAIAKYAMLAVALAALVTTLRAGRTGGPSPDAERRTTT